MSIFKVQKINPSSQLESKITKIPKIPILTLSIQSITTLNYQLSAMLDIVDNYFTQQDNDRTILLKTLKIVGASLGDSNLISKLDAILLKHLKREEKMYHLFSLWATFHPNIQTILARFSQKLRKELATSLMCYFLLKKGSFEEGIRTQLFKILTLFDSEYLMAQLKKKYNDWGQPLKQSIIKCMRIKTQNNQLINMVLKWVEYMLEYSQNKVLELIQNIEVNKEVMDYLILNIPRMSSNFIKHIKKTITPSNVFKMGSKNIKINTIFRTAVKEWINEQHNYWKVVDIHYGVDSTVEKAEILKLGKQLNKDQLHTECLSTKYLYHYFSNELFDFEKEDQLITTAPHQSWIDIYRSITQCRSFKDINFIAISINSAPKTWNQFNPFKNKTSCKPLQKLIDKYSDFYEEKEKEFMKKNKKIQLAFNTFLLLLKDSNFYITVTYEQLKSCLEQNKPIDKLSFRQIYQPYVEQIIKPKQQQKKEHNIIIEAKLVKLLKRHKECLSIDFFIKETKYTQEIVQLGLKRLVSKGIAEQDEKSQGYNYVP